MSLSLCKQLRVEHRKLHWFYYPYVFSQGGQLSLLLLFYLSHPCLPPHSYPCRTLLGRVPLPWSLLFSTLPFYAHIRQAPSQDFRLQHWRCLLTLLLKTTVLCPVLLFSCFLDPRKGLMMRETLSSWGISFEKFPGSLELAPYTCGKAWSYFWKCFFVCLFS